MSNYHGDIRLGDTIDIKFSTRAFASGAPTTLAGTPVISAYPGNSTTQLTAGITLTVDFDTVTGYHNVRVVATSGNGYATATNYDLCITTGTVGGVSVVGESIGSFSIENRSALMPTTAARTLDVSAGGEAGLDWANIGSPTTTVGLSGTTVNWNAAWDAEVQSEVEDAIVVHRLDELLNADSDIDGLTPPTVGSVFHELLTKTTGSFTYDQTTDSLEALRDHIGDGTNLTEAGGTGDHLTAINLPDQTMNITGNITGNLSGSVGSVTGLTAANLDVAISSRATPAQILTTALTESYAADGAAPTVTQAIMLIQQMLGDFAISGTTLSVKKLDGTTEAATFTLSDATSPTSITRAT